MSNLCLRLGIEVNDEILDPTNKKIGTVKVISPNYLLVRVGLWRIRYLDCRFISRSGHGLVNISVMGSEALSKTKPTKQSTVGQLLQSMSIPIGTYIYGSEGFFISRIDALRPGQILFFSDSSKWTAGPDQVDRYDEVDRRVDLSRVRQLSTNSKGADLLVRDESRCASWRIGKTERYDW